MPEKPRDLYGSFGGVREVLPQGGSGAGYMNVRASAADMGAGIGQGLEQAGAALERGGNALKAAENKFLHMTAEAKASQTWATDILPQVTQRRTQYDNLPDADKVTGYQNYISELGKMKEGVLKTAKSPYEAEILGGMFNRLYMNESESAQRELARSTQQFSEQAAAEKIKADAGYAANNYNNPKVIGQVEQSNDATILMQYLDKGADVSRPEVKAEIEQAQRAARGEMAVGMIQSAVSRGDAAAANKIRQVYGPSIPGHLQEAIDTTLFTESIRQDGVNYSTAIRTGQPLPAAVGFPPAEVQANVASAAQSHGIDPNHALTVAYIESNMGQNLGVRGDIGQTGKPGSLPEQAKNMAQHLKMSGEAAAKALGRPAEPWEEYVVYQQGVGGGPALLKAATENPTATAVDILKPLYKNPKDALDAITHNGGNATMSAGDYLKFLHRKYQQNAERAMCEIPAGQDAPLPTPEGTTILAQAPPRTLSDAIMGQYDTPGVTVQPAASPRGALNNFDEKFPAMLERAKAIPNLRLREAVINNLQQERNTMAMAANSYSSQLIGKAQDLAVNPGFTSLDQVPADLMAALKTEHPETIHYLRARAEDNIEKGSGVSNRDMRTYGPKFFDLFRDINAGKINSPVQLMQYLPQEGKDGSLTLAGYDRLQRAFSDTPKSSSENKMVQHSVESIKLLISGEDGRFKDPAGELRWGEALPVLYDTLEKGQKDGLSIGELTDPASKHWIGHSVRSFIRTEDQSIIDIIDATSLERPKRTLDQIRQEAMATKDPSRLEALKKEALDLGLIRERLHAPISR